MNIDDIIKLNERSPKSLSNIFLFYALTTNLGPVLIFLNNTWIIKYNDRGYFEVTTHSFIELSAFLSFKEYLQWELRVNYDYK